MVRATMSLIEATPVILAMVTVRVFLDRGNENCYLDVQFEHDADELAYAHAYINDAGLELIPESECPTQIIGGWSRIYLADRE